MSINNLNTYTKPTFSVAEMCINRNAINRDLKTGPGFKFSSDGREYNKRIYLDETGLIVDKSDITDKYNLSGRKVLEIFDRAGGDYIEAHKELLKSSKRKKGRKS
tara:strand:+ start:185 stop:499 length:315 start_codon:yes stop_codon:yes gene_type:complete